MASWGHKGTLIKKPTWWHLGSSGGQAIAQLSLPMHLKQRRAPALDGPAMPAALLAPSPW